MALSGNFAVLVLHKKQLPTALVELRRLISCVAASLELYGISWKGPNSQFPAFE